MLKMLNQYSEYQRLNLILCGLDCALFEVSNDIKDYIAYKDYTLSGISEEREKEMIILSLLEQLGFPMNEVGTYLYKNMINKVINYLGKVETRQDIFRCKELIYQLKDGFSQFYVDVARNDLDMGIKTFHKYVEEAISKVDYSKVDPAIIVQIYGNFSESIDYGEQALILGAYVSGNLISRGTEGAHKKPLVRKLTSVPDVVLKIDF